MENQIKMKAPLLLPYVIELETDKEVSVPGDRWRRYITTDRTIHPAVSKEALNEIIMPGYIENLRPERRFDQTLWISNALLHNE